MSLTDFLRQVSILIGLPAVIIAGVAAALIVIARDWRVTLFAYAVFSVMLALLLSQVIPAEWALQQVIVGGLIAVMLYLSARQLRGPRDALQPPELRWPRMASLTGFRFLVMVLLGVAFLALRTRIAIPLVDPLFSNILLWLVVVSVAGLTLHEEPLHAGLALLIYLAAAELLVFTLTQRRMMIGLWQGMQLLCGLAIAYLVLAHGLAAAAPAEQEESENGGAP